MREKDFLFCKKLSIFHTAIRKLLWNWIRAIFALDSSLARKVFDYLEHILPYREHLGNHCR